MGESIGCVGIQLVHSLWSPDIVIFEVLFAYDAEAEDELTIREGQIVAVLDESDGCLTLSTLTGVPFSPCDASAGTLEG